MKLFKKEKPAKTISLAELYGHAEGVTAAAEAMKFDLYRSGQRVFRNAVIRFTRSGALPAGLFVGSVDEGAADQALTRLVMTQDGADALHAFVSAGIIANVRKIPAGDEGEPAIADLAKYNGDRDVELARILGELPDLPFILLGAANKAQAEYVERAEETSKKSSASSAAKPGKRTRKRGA